MSFLSQAQVQHPSHSRAGPSKMFVGGDGYASDRGRLGRSLLRQDRPERHEYELTWPSLKEGLDAVVAVDDEHAREAVQEEAGHRGPLGTSAFLRTHPSCCSQPRKSPTQLGGRAWLEERRPWEPHPADPPRRLWSEQTGWDLVIGPLASRSPQRQRSPHVMQGLQAKVARIPRTDPRRSSGERSHPSRRGGARRRHR
jgi:hypothetical protein